MPVRLQRSRRKGYRLPPDAVYVGRPTAWGNDFRAGECQDCWYGQHDGEHRPATPADAVEEYRSCWEAMAWTETQASHPIDLFEDLRGKDLACWCPLACGEPVALYGVANVDKGVLMLLADGEEHDPCTKPAGHNGPHDPSALYCHADVLLELANR